VRIDPGEVQRLLDQLVASGAPGAGARVEDEGGTHQAAAGVAHIRTGRAMRSDLRFRAGSLTKSFVAVLVLKLVAEGTLSLSDTVAQWLPRILPYGGEVTVAQLLNHTGGVPHNAPLVWRELWATAAGRFRAWTPRQLVALVADRPQDFPPGSGWAYSNTGYALLHMVVEAATGGTLRRELSRQILGPLRLSRTSFPVNARGIPSPSSRGYSLPLSPQLEVLDGPLVDFTAQNPSYAGAAGAMVSVLGDLTGFFRGVLGGQVLPRHLLAEMLTTVPVPPASIPLPLFERYGMGIMEVETPAGSLLGHAGGIPGFLSIVLSTPDGGRQLAVMVNVGDRPPDPLVEPFIHGFRELAVGLFS